MEKTVPASAQAEADKKFEEKVLAAFFDADGRLLRIPVQRKKRLVVLRRIADTFSPDTAYTEEALSERIAAFHSDYCTIRREFIAEHLMTRSDGVYRRV